jgi:hypothetical protein
MSKMDEQRVLMGIANWDRSVRLSEAKRRVHASNTAKWVGDAMESLKKARKSAGHRKLAQNNEALYGSLQAAYQACQEAYQACMTHGEAYDEEFEDEIQESRESILRRF